MLVAGRWWGVLAGLVAMIGLPAAAAERPWARYAEVQEIWVGFEKLPPAQRSHLQFRVRAAPGGGATGPVRLTMQTRNGVREVPVTGGVLKLPSDAELLRENPMIMTSLPAGTPLLMRPELLFVPLTPPGITMAGLAARLDQANRALKAQAGIWAFFAPKARTVELVFTDPATEVSLRQPGKMVRLAPDKDGRVVVKPDRGNSNVELVYSTAPVQARPVFAATMVLRAGDD